MKKKKLRFVLYALGMLFAFQAALPAYINSSFISQYFSSEKSVGLLYTISSILSIVGLLFIPLILKKFGNYKAILFFIILNIFSLLSLIFVQNGNILILSFIIYLILNVLVYFNLDIFLEQQSEDKNTGNIRGRYLTSMNTAWLISPFLLGCLLTDGDYWKVYTAAIIALIPFLVLLFINFRNFKDPLYQRVSFWKTFKKLTRRKNIYKIFMVRIYLQFFYSWMVIYTPIYLHKYVGLDWKTIGLIFTIMLLPFVLFQLPLGTLADKKYGEKEILNIGIIILSLSTIGLSFINCASFWAWAIILFLTRIGASAVEITSESYFFKHIEGKDADIISFFNMTRPLAYTIAPLVASFALFFVDFRFIFLISGIITLTALKYGLTLKDTK